jgi:hypothetical protein
LGWVGPHFLVSRALLLGWCAVIRTTNALILNKNQRRVYFFASFMFSNRFCSGLQKLPFSVTRPQRDAHCFSLQTPTCPYSQQLLATLGPLVATGPFADKVVFVSIDVTANNDLGSSEHIDRVPIMKLWKYVQHF